MREIQWLHGGSKTTCLANQRVCRKGKKSETNRSNFNSKTLMERTWLQFAFLSSGSRKSSLSGTEQAVEKGHGVNTGQINGLWFIKIFVCGCQRNQHYVRGTRALVQIHNHLSSGSSGNLCFASPRLIDSFGMGWNSPWALESPLPVYKNFIKNVSWYFGPKGCLSIGVAKKYNPQNLFGAFSVVIWLVLSD